MYLLTLVVMVTTYMTLYSGVGAIDIVKCENDSAGLNCPTDYKILVNEVLYGRRDTTTCQHAQMYDTNCNSTTSFSQTVSRCTGKQSCNVPATNSFFGDPCVGTYKYLRIDYNCIQAEFTKVTCEGEAQHLSCPHNWLIRIDSANYGRTSVSVCPSSADSDTSCNLSTSLSKMQSACDGKTSCRVEATNEVFGDPCVGTYKYLETTYECYL